MIKALTERHRQVLVMILSTDLDALGVERKDQAAVRDVLALLKRLKRKKPKKKRTDFCAPYCTCQINGGEVMCVKLLPAAAKRFGKIETDCGSLVDAINTMIEE